MPRIASVTARSVVVPLDVPTSFSTRRVTDRHYTLVRVTDDEGVSGIGFCYAGSAGGALPALARRLEPSHAPLAAATTNARFVEFFPDDQVLNFRRLLDRQLEVRDGALVLHDGPGLGFDFDEDAVGRWVTADGG